MANRILKPNMGRTAWTPGQKPSYGARINPQHPLSQGLVGAWLFNEGGGDKCFNLVDGFSSALENGTTWDKKGLSFATNDANRVNVGYPTPFRFTSEDYTLLFILTNATVTQEYSVLLCKGNNTYGYFTGLHPSIGGAIYHQHQGQQTRTAVSDGYINGKTQQIAIIKKGNKAYIYVDGVDKTSVQPTLSNITWTTEYPLWFGAWVDGTQYDFDGIMHSIYIYNRALSNYEINNFYANPYQMFEWPVQDFLVGEISAEDFSGWSDLIKNTLKLDYGASTYAGDQLRKTGKYSVGSFPSTGAATKKTTKTFEGIWSAVADLIAQLVGAAQKFYQDCISVFAPAGIILKKSTHNFIGDLTSIGTLVRKGIKSLAGSAAFIGDITRFIGKKIIRTLSTLGELLAQKSGIIYQVCLAGLTFSAKSIKSSSTKLSGAIQTIGTLIKKSLPKSLSGFLNSSAKIIRMPVKLATGTATFIGTISRFIYKKIIRTFTTIGDILTQKTGAIYKSLAAGMTFSGRVIKSYSMKLSGMFQDLGAIIKKPLKIVKGGFTTAASVVRLRGRILTAILSSTGAIYKKTFKELLSNLESTGNIIRFIYFSIGAIKSFIGDLLTRVFRTIIGILHHRTYFVPLIDREILLPTDRRTYVIEKDDNTYEINE